MQKIVIIGNGIAGVTTARHLRKLNSDVEITIVSSESKYFFSRTALMYVFMGHMKFEHTQPYEEEFWIKNRIDLVFAHVEKINIESKTLDLNNAEILHYDKLVIASGSKYNKFDLPNITLSGVQGLYSKQDLEILFENAVSAKRAVVVGGGLIGIELAEMLSSQGIETHFLIREKLFWGSVLPEADSKLIMDHLKKHHNLYMHYEEELAEINGENRVSSITTKKGTVINCDILGLSIGVSANKALAEAAGINCKKGILVNEFLETNVPDIYAIGDCVEMIQPKEGRKSIEQVWYVGRMMGETVAPTLLGTRNTYNPGPWFNSAKFFDIEYQTYGKVNPKLDENETEFVWQHPTEEILLHFVYDKTNLEFIGLNAFGIRMRHEILDQYLRNEATIKEVLENLNTINFDPEFYKTYGREIILAFNLEKNQNLRLNKKIWWRKLLNSENK